MSYIEEHISYKLGKIPLHFIRRPVAGILPADRWIGFVEQMNGEGRSINRPWAAGATVLGIMGRAALWPSPLRIGQSYAARNEKALSPA